MNISPRDYVHPEDKAAFDNLKNIPLFSSCVKAFLKSVPEQFLYGMNMAQKIRLSEEQLPNIYKYLPPICKTLGIDEPEFYLEMSPSPNAYTYGDTKVFLTVTSGLIEYLQEDEIQAVIAHECGHIACQHVLYHTMAEMLIKFGTAIFGPAAIMSAPIKYGLLHWQRRSEFSADRAAAVVMDGHKSVVDTMIRLAGGPKSITEDVNVDLYIKQSEVYDKLLEESQWNMVLQGIAIMEQSHPFLSVRTAEIIKWCKTEEFNKIIKFKNGEFKTCPTCGGNIETGWRFCKNCGTSIK